jgi:hypothetical protein
VAHQIAQRRESGTEIFLRIGESQQGPVFACIVNRAGKRWAARLDAVEAEAKYVLALS